MSEVLAAYQRLRDAGCKHLEAVRELMVRLDLDRDTIGRILSRAEKDERRLGARASRTPREAT